MGTGGASSTSLIGQDGTPAACGLDFAGTGFLTTYLYNALDDLIQVNQGTVMAPRTFSYDSLSRLTSANNPESGPVSYTYDANGNLSTKTATAPNQNDINVTVTTGYQYDALNRLTQKSYSDGTTPTATFYYDKDPQGRSYTNLVGRLFESTVPSSAGGTIGTLSQYDPMGRITDQWQYTPLVGANAFPFTYQYDLMGNLTYKTLGFFNPISIAYNTAARPTSFTTSGVEWPSQPNNLISNAHYNAAGQVGSETLGTGEVETYTYDTRLRLKGMSSVLNTTSIYSYSLGFAPNGDVISANDSVNGNWNYSYDQFNRLVCSNLSSNGTCTTPPTGTPTYTYVYDRFGNRWQQNGPNSMQLSFTGNNSTNNNQMDSYLTGFSYDWPGNLLFDGTHQYFYDAENRLIQVDGTLPYCTSNGASGSAATACYLYDAEGRRVHRTGMGNDVCDGTGVSDFAFDLEGHWTTQTNSTGGDCKSEIYIAGHHFGTSGGTIYFDHTDWLGTSRLRNSFTNPTSGYETCTSLPFGDALTCNNTFSTNIHFTSKERDSESGLDNFGARYFGSGMGRFMSPDWSSTSEAVPYAKLDDPQSLNLYAYARNNPINATDPDGHECVDAGEKHGWLWCAAHALGLIYSKGDKLLEASNFFHNNDVRDANGNRIDPDKLNDNQLLQVWQDFNDQWRAAAEQGQNPASAMAGFFTQWGWRGQGDYNKAKNLLNETNTPQGTVDRKELLGKVPTKEEALQMIKDAGGNVERIEEGHPAGGVSTHQNPHINYTTASGAKGTIDIKP